jgi:hypothetical protein
MGAVTVASKIISLDDVGGWALSHRPLPVCGWQLS